MKALIILLFLSPWIAVAQIDTMTIQIKLKGMPERTAFYLIDDSTAIDSSISKKGTLSFIYKKATLLPQPLLVKSKKGKKSYIIWVDKGSVDFSGDFKTAFPLASKSKTQNEYTEYLTGFSKVNKTKNYHDSLKAFNAQFIRANPSSVIGKMSLYADLNDKHFTDTSTLKAYKKLIAAQKALPPGINELKSIAVYREPVIGSPVPYFSIPNQNGREVNLADFKGKNIFLFFWASWCAPCMREMPEVTKLYEEVKNKNIVFVAVSLDKKEQPWLKAVKENTLQFINLSDLKGWDNEAAVLFGVDGVPDNFLIDEKGILVERERGIEKISKKMMEMLK